MSGRIWRHMADTVLPKVPQPRLEDFVGKNDKIADQSLQSTKSLFDYGELSFRMLPILARALALCLCLTTSHIGTLRQGPGGQRPRVGALRLAAH